MSTGYRTTTAENGERLCKSNTCPDGRVEDARHFTPSHERWARRDTPSSGRASGPRPHRVKIASSRQPAVTERAPLRVLQVVGGMTRGGVETWLLNVLRKIDRSQLQMDFLVHATEPCA